ncbi:unnamed protein product [Fusarium venenatum]|uniref:Lysine-specific metallo-endopeptidase domain-containing protein n=1 Tax=Fusarium venenatum TaxID=56646 RepID=A0A2L2TAJ3_9HYPO|nr:uncharacterized protein FVRRES_05783 [Fusarium venenatum]CEI61347.1 unnamed protein product [Fusarium venenatum]
MYFGPASFVPFRPGGHSLPETQTSENVVYDVFFDTEDGTPAKVHEFSITIAGEGTVGTRAGPKVGNMIIDNTAATFPDTRGLHPLALPFPMACLNKYPSTKMDNFSRVALHEILHYSTIGPESALGEQIGDQLNNDNEPAYSPERAHSLQVREQWR